MSNQKILWKPTNTQINQSQMMGYAHFINKQFGLDIDKYENLYKWSIDNIDIYENKSVEIKVLCKNGIAIV